MSINHCSEFVRQVFRSRTPARRVPKAGCGAYTPLWVRDGNVTIEVRKVGSDELVEKQRIKNRVVTTGLWAMRDLLVDYGLSPKFFAVGDNATPTTDDMEALQSEKFRTLISRADRIGNKAVFQAYLTQDDAVGETLQEAGLFVNTGWAKGILTPGGALFARATYTPITKTSGVWVTFTWEIPVGSG